MKRIFINWSPAIAAILLVLAGVGYYLGSGLQLKLSLTDLLPKNHPAVVKFEKLTEVVGGVGYFSVILTAPDGKSHLKAVPGLIAELKKSPLVRSAFYRREQRFFTDRLLYYVDTDKLLDLEKNIDSEILKAKRKVFDIGLWDEEKKSEKPIFDDELKKRARASGGITPFLTSKDKTQLLLMVKPNFDSMDLAKTNDLIKLSEKVLKEKLPPQVTYEFAERYYSKVVETNMIQTDIVVLGTLSILLIAFLIYIHLRSFRSLMMIFIPVMMGMGITVGVARLAIGHINIITGFLMGIVSGLGVDYGIHLVLRLRLERANPSSSDPDPVWRTLASSGHSVFVGAAAAAMAFFLLCFSSFRAFSEFGFICGVGIVSVLVCLLSCFSVLARILKYDVAVRKETFLDRLPPLPVLTYPRKFFIGILVTAVLLIAAFRVEFEYDFNKMLQHSSKMEGLNKLVDTIYERSSSPSALSAPTKEEALAVEKMIKAKYMPNIVGELLSGASIVPDNQPEKQVILERIRDRIKPLRNKWLEESLDVPANVVRGWVNAKPFAFKDLPAHLQDAFRGTKDEGFLLYLYPAIHLSDVKGVRTYAAMIRDIETQYPNLLTGSDAVVFSDILDLINRDGLIIMAVIFLSVGLFIWINVRKWDDTLLSYLPLLISLPVGMGLMAIFGVKFNIFNIAIIPTFVAMGIDVPIHIVHRTRETGSGFRAARDMASSINLALLTAGVGFGVLIFARAGVLKSLGWIALLGTLAIWWVGLFVLPAFMEKYSSHKDHKDAGEDEVPLATSENAAPN